MLAYLVCRRSKPQRRDRLVEMFWPDRPLAEGRRCFRTGLWRLRRLVAAGSAEVIEIDADWVCFRTGDACWLDAQEFENIVTPLSRQHDGVALSPEQAALLEHALELYRGDFLDGIDEPWVVAEQQRLQAMQHMAASLLLDRFENFGDDGRVLQVATGLLEQDPMFESVHRAVMRCHMRMGNRALALRQYDRCASLLHGCLRVEPMPATQQLAAEIGGGRSNFSGPATKQQG